MRPHFFTFHPRHAGRRGPMGGFMGMGGRFGGSGGPGFGGGFPMGRGRKLGSADLQLLLLSLLAEAPRHGYELIKALDERSKGYYSPSPGMVYPALTYLEETGLADVQAEGNKKLYRVTDAGREHLQANQSLVDALQTQLTWLGEQMGVVQAAVGSASLDAATSLEAGRRGRPGGPLGDGLRRLKQALGAKLDAPADEQARIAAVLQRATDEILRG